MAVNDVGANKTPAALKRASKCLGIICNLLDTFDDDFGLTHACGSHSSPETNKDMDIIIQELVNNKVFQSVKDRSYTCTSMYNKVKENLYQE